MHIFRNFVPLYDIAARVVHEHRFGRICRIAFGVVARFFNDLVRVRGSIVSALRKHHLAFAGCVPGKYLAVRLDLDRRHSALYHRRVFPCGAGRSACPGACPGDCPLLEAFLGPAHLLYICRGTADILCRQLYLIFTPRLEQQNIPVSFCLHHRASHSSVSRFSEISAHGVFEMRSSRGDAYLKICKRSACQNARMLFLFKVRPYKPLPVQRQLVLRHIARDHYAAAALCGAYDEMDFGVMAQRLEVADALVCIRDRFKIEHMTLPETNFVSESFFDYLLQDLELDLAHYPDLYLAAVLAPRSRQRRIFRSKRLHIGHHFMRILPVRHADRVSHERF